MHENPWGPMPPELRLDVRGLVERVRREFAKRTGDVTISVPFVSFSVSPVDKERAAAREILIRLSDRRVLSAQECCDNCIDQALGSLQDIRRILVEKQVELAALADGPVYLLVELMLEPIRQFLTFTQRLPELEVDSAAAADFRRLPEVRQAYFGALETLRGHLHRTLMQLAAVADIQTPRISQTLQYEPDWQLASYEQPALPS